MESIERTGERVLFRYFILVSFPMCVCVRAPLKIPPTTHRRDYIRGLYIIYIVSIRNKKTTTNIESFQIYARISNRIHSLWNQIKIHFSNIYSLRHDIYRKRINTRWQAKKDRNRTTIQLQLEWIVECSIIFER